ncbi:unnamed protein product [Rhizopus microsporus]
MTINTQDSEKDKRRQSQGGSIDYAVVANPVLVGPTAEDETNENTDTNETQSTMVLSRIDVIFQKRMAEGLTIEDVDFLTQSTRKKTHKAIDSQAYDPKSVYRFLHEHAHLSAPALNVYRSSIASVFNIIHEDTRYIADDPLIVSFFQTKRKSETKIPTIGKTRNLGYTATNCIRPWMEPQCTFSPSEIAKENHYLHRHRVYDATSLGPRQITVWRRRFVLIGRRATTWGILNIKRTKRKPMEDNQAWNSRASKRR